MQAETQLDPWKLLPPVNGADPPPLPKSYLYPDPTPEKQEGPLISEIDFILRECFPFDMCTVCVLNEA